METSLIKLYCKIDDMLKKIGKKDDIQAKMSSSEIVFVAIVSAKYYGCNFENTRHSIESRRLVNHMLSKSQFNRRLHALGPKLWEAIIRNLGDIALAQATNKAFVIDSFPIPVCVNWRIGRCSIYEEEVYRGYIAAKRIYFFGIRCHCLISAEGKLVRLIFAPGSAHDLKVAKTMEYDFLPKGSIVYADKAYNDYELEDDLEKRGVTWLPIRKKNSKRPLSSLIQKCQSKTRKFVETVFSCITSMMPRKIHAVTAKGFELKSLLFFLAYGFSKVTT